MACIASMLCIEHFTSVVSLLVKSVRRIGEQEKTILINVLHNGVFSQGNDSS